MSQTQDCCAAHSRYVCMYHMILDSFFAVHTTFAVLCLDTALWTSTAARHYGSVLLNTREAYRATPINTSSTRECQFQQLFMYVCVTKTRCGRTRVLLLLCNKRENPDYHTAVPVFLRTQRYTGGPQKRDPPAVRPRL